MQRNVATITRSHYRNSAKQGWLGLNLTNNKNVLGRFVHALSQRITNID